MTDFTKVRSNFGKQAIKFLEYTDKTKNYVEKLMMIEEYAMGERMGVGIASAQIKHILMHKYPKEWLTIFKELNPSEVEKYNSLLKDMDEDKDFEGFEEIASDYDGESQNSWKQVQNSDQ